MATCRDCKSEKVAWDKTKAGRAYLRDFGQPHHLTCSKNGQRPAKKLKPNELGLAANATEAQVRAALKEHARELKENGRVG